MQITHVLGGCRANTGPSPCYAASFPIILHIQNARISTRYGNSAGQFNSIIPLETISILETYQTNKIAVTGNPATHTAYDS
jgi:hypothetical protein